MRRAYRALPLLAGFLLVGFGEGDGRGEIVVRNDSFSTLTIAVVDAAGRELEIGTAPPEFANTLYFAAADAPAAVRFRARLRGGDDVVHESEAVSVRTGTRLHWKLPDNVLEAKVDDAVAGGRRGPRPGPAPAR